MQATTTASQRWVKGTGWKLDSVTVAGNDIVITVLGSGTTPPVNDLRSAVRRSVPTRVPVQLVQENGTTTGS